MVEGRCQVQVVKRATSFSAVIQRNAFYHILYTLKAVRIFGCSHLLMDTVVVKETQNLDFRGLHFSPIVIFS